MSSTPDSRALADCQSDYYKLKKKAIELVTVLKDVIYTQLIQGTTHCPSEDSPVRRAERFIEKYENRGF